MHTQNYVVKTKRQFRCRIWDHLSDIRHRRDTPVVRLVLECHDSDPINLRFSVVEVVRQSHRMEKLEYQDFTQR